MAVFWKLFCVFVFIAVKLSVRCDKLSDRDQVTQQDTQNPLGQDNKNHVIIKAGENLNDDTPNNAHVTENTQHEGRPNTVDSDSVVEHGPIISNCTNTSNDSCDGGQGVTGYFRKMVSDNKDMLLRTFYVIISITGIIIVYFVIKMIRTRQRQSRTKRYGLLSSRDDHLEMTPLDADDDEDDMTLFDVNQTK